MMDDDQLRVPAAPADCQHPICVRVGGQWICGLCQATVLDDD